MDITVELKELNRLWGTAVGTSARKLKKALLDRFDKIMATVLAVRHGVRTIRWKQEQWLQNSVWETSWKTSRLKTEKDMD
jgi:hypothetical protein